MSLRIQRDMKEELERLKTQFTFKQHELETATVRRTPWNPNRLTQGYPPSTPVPPSSQMRRWNQPEVRTARPPLNLQNAVAGPSGLGRRPDSPPRPKFGTLSAPDTPHRRNKKAIQPPPVSPSKQRHALPGFENAFLPSPKRKRPPEPTQPIVPIPLRGLEKGGDELEGRLQEPAPHPMLAHLAPESSQRSMNNPPPLTFTPPSPPSSPARRKSVRSEQAAALRKEMDEEGQGGEDEDVDVVMDAEPDMSFSMDLDGDYPTQADSSEADEVMKLDPPDWVAHVSSSLVFFIVVWRRLIRVLRRDANS